MNKILSKNVLLICIALLLGGFANAAKVDTIQVKSPSMNKTIKNLVILPDDYNASQKR